MTAGSVAYRRPMSIARLALMVAALAAGVVIGWVDSSPGWDSTAITAVVIFVASAGAAWVGRDRPWLWALLVGLPTVVLGLVRAGNDGSVLALGFAGVGAAAGWTLARTRRG